LHNPYHDQVLNLFIFNFSFFQDSFGFDNVRSFHRNVHVEGGEIDVIVNGLISGVNAMALVEVKAHSGVCYKFRSKQFHYYRKFDSNASVYLLCGSESGSLRVEDFNLKRYWPLCFD
jgi:hypothetical protein